MSGTFEPDGLFTQEKKMNKKYLNSLYHESDTIGFESLFGSLSKCLRGVLWKDSAASFWHRGLEKISKLCEALANGTYRAAPPKYFQITSPKPRDIASVSFRDRVYQRSLNDNVVYPSMTKGFIYDNFACQKGKGTDPARERLKSFLRDYYRKYGRDGYAAQFDIHGYYPNMRHDVTEENFRAHLPEWAFERVRTILHEQYTGEVGYNPGSQLIQIAGISMLNDLDHAIKEKLHVHYYIRYMDDLILIHPDPEYLMGCYEFVEQELSKIGFEPNPNKSMIYPLREGIEFLGFRFRLTETGKVVMTVDPKRIKAGRKKYRRLVDKAKRTGIPRESVDQSFETWIHHLSKGNSYHVISRLRKYYNDLWRERDGYQTQSMNPG